MKRFLKRFSGRIAGSALGLLAGPAGLVFGFLAGWLVDQYLTTMTSGQRLERFLRTPHRESHRATAAKYTVAALLGIVAPEIAAGPERLRELSRDRPWLRVEPELLEQICRYRQRHHVDSTILIKNAATLFATPEERERLVFLLLDALGRGELGRGEHYPGSVSSEQSAVLQDLTAFLPPGPEATAAVDILLTSLDAHSCRVLGVGPEADRDAVRHAYRRLATNLHPDTANGLELHQQGEIQEAFLRVGRAYDTLIRQLDERDRRRDSLGNGDPLHSSSDGA